MSMAFTHAGVGDLYKSSRLQIFNRFSTAITHTCTQAPHELVNDLAQKAFIGNTSLNAFGNIFFCIGFRILEVTVAASA